MAGDTSLSYTSLEYPPYQKVNVLGHQMKWSTFAIKFNLLQESVIIRLNLLFGLFPNWMQLPWKRDEKKVSSD